MAYVNVAEWKPEQVTEWLKGLDFVVQSYVQSFLNNEVNGQQLLSLRPDDLNHLGVQKLGHQELILEAVEHLRNFHYELDRENLQLLALRLSCRARSLYNELQHTDSKRVSTQTMADVANIITAVKPIACWLGRSPFAGNSDYHNRKMELLNLSLEIATCAQRDRFAERPVEEIRSSCDKLASLADSIIRDIQDPLLLQPASLDLATVKKRAGDDLGFFIQPSFHGIHQISELKFSSPAQQCGKIEAGDEIVQVNYQTVVGWQSKKVMFLLEESPTDVFLTLKKRPRHTKVYGQIYIKPYRLPSKKRAAPYARWHENLPSPRPELLTIPDFEIPLPRSCTKQRVEQLETMHLGDSEPLASSSSSGDDDDDDTAFLPGVADLAQVSPTSMRLYLPKQRAAVQRRATVTGASPTSRRPPVNIEQLRRELQQWRGGALNSPLFQLREKPGGISSSLMSMADALRPTTCLGIEQSINSSLYKDKYPQEKIFSSSIKVESKAKEVTLNPVGSEETKKKRTSPAREIEQMEEEQTRKSPAHEHVERSFSSPVFNLQRIEPLIDSVKKNSGLKKCNESCEITISPPEDFQPVTPKGSSTYQDAKDNFVTSYVEQSNNLTDIHSSVEKPKVAPIDENIMKIPPGHMKYIDDPSDSNFFSDLLEENDSSYSGVSDYGDSRRGAQQVYSSTSEVPLTHSHGHNLKIRTNTHATKSVDKVPFSACCVNDLSESQGASNISNVRQIQNIAVHTHRILNSNNDSAKLEKEREELETLSNAVVTKYPVKKSNILELPPRNQNRTQAKNKPSPPQKPPQHSFNMSCVSNSSTSSSPRNKFAQSLSQFTSGRPIIPLICSPKTLKKRNALLAKRRNVSLKELGGADCEGWLLHRCRWSGAGAALGTTWTRAWFVLKGSIFYGFKSPHASKANIMISLPGFTVSVAEEVKSKKYAFKVYHTGTVFYFAAETEQQLASWLESIAAGTALQDTNGKPLEFNEIFFSETDEDSDHETEMESGTCFPTPKSSKFASLLGSGGSPSTCRSQQNLASDAKIGHEVQKKFGSLKKLGRKVQDIGSSTSHHDGNTSASLDRKYLCFLGSGRNSTVPVPTAQFRSYRRVPSNTPSKASNEVFGQKVNELAMRGSANMSYETTKEAMKKSLNTTNQLVDISGYSKPKNETNDYTTVSNLSSSVTLESNRGKEKDTTANKCPLPDLLLKPSKMCDLRDRSTHASNPTLQLSGDMSDYRLAAERLREFNMQRNRAREDTTGFVTLEEFMLSRQEEERRAERLRARPLEEKHVAPTEVTRPGHDMMRQASFNSTNSSRSVGASSKDTNTWDAGSSPESIRVDHSDVRRTTGNNELKSVAQYQPPPPPVTARRSQDDNSPQPLALAFEMHLGERESTSNKSTLKFRNIFSSSKSSSHRQQQQKQHQLDVPSESWSKTLLGSPRLRRALFKDKQPKGSSSSESTCSSVSQPVVSATPDWVVEANTDAALAQTKPTMGVAMLGKRPSRRTPIAYPPPTTAPAGAPACTPPDYPGLEYPPVFEPETYTLADASTLRSRPSRAHSDK